MQRWLYERVSLLRYTCTVCFVNIHRTQLHLLPLLVYVTNTLNILPACPMQQWLYERVSFLRYMCTVRLVNIHRTQLHLLPLLAYVFKCIYNIFYYII